MLSCFFFNDTATTEIYTLSLHDALPIYLLRAGLREPSLWLGALARVQGAGATSLLPERHLGLVAAHELDDALQRLDVAADALLATPLGQLPWQAEAGQGASWQDWSVDFEPCPEQIGRASCRERV